MRILRALSFGLAMVVTLGGFRRAEAQTQFVPSRLAFGTAEVVDWNQVAPAFGTAVRPFTIVSSIGLPLRVSQPVGGFEIYNQNPPEPHPDNLNTGWAGSFKPGDPILYTAVPGEGPISIEFGAPVAGVGAQIESGQYGEFTAKIEAFDR